MTSNISNDDENFLKEFLKEFYRQIINIENYKNFKNTLTEWIQDYFNYNEKDTKIFLKLMKEHEENENWFSSLIGFFYENGIGYDDDDDNDGGDILIYYLKSIKNYENDENKKLKSIYQLLNIIISKYLLSFYYYKDIILDKKIMISKEFKILENVHHVMSYNQFENFNGLKINICKDELINMEKYFESQDNKDDFNENQLLLEKNELIELNNLGYCYQHGVIVIKMVLE
ncbi:unnamed protein product [Rhizophagus irregularis]|nr:unnamed protein product [Rhizophagus irregularis]CAB5350392.1 unnamed protein product [Rhizophagus irregularis]